MPHMITAASTLSSGDRVEFYTGWKGSHGMRVPKGTTGSVVINQGRVLVKFDDPLQAGMLMRRSSSQA